MTHLQFLIFNLGIKTGFTLGCIFLGMYLEGRNKIDLHVSAGCLWASVILYWVSF